MLCIISDSRIPLNLIFDRFVISEAVFDSYYYFFWLLFFYLLFLLLFLVLALVLL